MHVYHIPVMTEQLGKALNMKPGDSLIDGTIGEGGHALELLIANTANTRLLGIDANANVIRKAQARLSRFNDRLSLVHGNFSQIIDIAQSNGFSPAQAIYLDLGISSFELEGEQRGFSFRRDEWLDMRFDAQQPLTAHEVINTYPADRLADIVFRLGEEPKARTMARIITQNRPIHSTKELAAVALQAAKPGYHRIHPATRLFQAIRMEVNQELEALHQGIEGAIQLLDQGGRLVIISYHSLEDRMVKGILGRESRNCICEFDIPECTCGHKATMRLVNKKVERPSREEVRRNPRSRSAKMRIAERLNKSQFAF